MEIPQSDPCPFCRRIEGAEECAFIYRDDKVASIMDLYPVERGHALVVPVEHFTSALDVPAEIAMRAFEHATQLAAAAVRALGATGVNIFQNNGVNAGQRIAHYHIHVLPRYPDKDFDEVRKLVEEEMGRFAPRGRSQLSATDGQELVEILQGALADNG